MPEEYVHTMRDSLLDKCPVSSFAQVVQTLDEELGAPPSVLFAEFDPEPMASASLAQVALCEIKHSCEKALNTVKMASRSDLSRAYVHFS